LTANSVCYFNCTLCGVRISLKTIDEINNTFRESVLQPACGYVKQPASSVDWVRNSVAYTAKHGARAFDYVPRESTYTALVGRRCFWRGGCWLLKMRLHQSLRLFWRRTLRYFKTGYTPVWHLKACYRHI
jgi:hypothetical protein